MGSPAQIIGYRHGFQGNVTWALLATLALQKSVGKGHLSVLARAALVSACNRGAEDAISSQPSKV